MQSRRDLERLAGKALLDKEFRSRLLAKPKEVALEEGVSLEEAELDALQTVDATKLEEWLAALDPLMRRPPGWWKGPPPHPRDFVTKDR